MSESESTATASKRGRPRNVEEDYAPQAGNEALVLTCGPMAYPVTFNYSSPHHHFHSGLNRILMVLPELLSRLVPPGELPYEAEGNVRNVVANATATVSDYMILCDASAGAFDVSLPTATAMGKTLIIVKVDSSVNAVTVVPFGNDRIQGAASLSLSAQWAKAILSADGVSGWLDQGTGMI